MRQDRSDLRSEIWKPKRPLSPVVMGKMLFYVCAQIPFRIFAFPRRRSGRPRSESPRNRTSVRVLRGVVNSVVFWF